MCVSREWFLLSLSHLLQCHLLQLHSSDLSVLFYICVVVAVLVPLFLVGSVLTNAPLYLGGFCAS